jgi:hypothetical protein
MEHVRRLNQQEYTCLQRIGGSEFCGREVITAF